MAPPSLALRGVGPSTMPYLSSRSFASSSSHLEARQGALGWWDEASRFRYDSVHDEGGRFNGTCSDSELTLAPQPQRGYCASYYPDVTTFCCGAVGGILVSDQQETDADAATSSTSRSSTTTSSGATSGTASSSSATSTTPSSSSSSDSAMPTDLGSPSTLISEPSCMTTNYVDMLECYRDTTEQHCKGALNGPYGVCNAYGADTSRSVSSSSAASSSTSRAVKGWKGKAAIAVAFGVALAGSMSSGGVS